LAALLPVDSKIAEDVGARLKLSTAQRRRLVSATEPVDGEHRALAYSVGTEGTIDRLLLAGLPIDALDGWSPPRFPLSGGAIIARGISAGPEVARLLKAVEARWVAEGFPTADRAEQLADVEVAQALRSAKS
jgi:poly(A) polymerase